jgi:hypothetical protein
MSLFGGGPAAWGALSVSQSLRLSDSQTLWLSLISLSHSLALVSFRRSLASWPPCLPGLTSPLFPACRCCNSPLPSPFHHTSATQVSDPGSTWISTGLWEPGALPGDTAPWANGSPARRLSKHAAYRVLADAALHPLSYELSPLARSVASRGSPSTRQISKRRAGLVSISRPRPRRTSKLSSGQDNTSCDMASRQDTAVPLG